MSAPLSHRLCIVLLPVAGCFFQLEDDDDDDQPPPSAPAAAVDTPTSEPRGSDSGWAHDTGERLDDGVYDTYDGFDLLEVTTAEGSRRCRLGWGVTGEPASTLCAGCIWAFEVVAVRDDRYADVADCDPPTPFTATYAIDPRTMFYAYGDSWVPMAQVQEWDPTARDYNLTATREVPWPGTESAELLHIARVR